MLLADRKFAFEEHLSKQGLCLARKSPSILQINLGKLCNLACVHCHVNAGPGRKEIMDPATFDRVIDWIARSPSIETVDLTGGAPEMNPDFREFIVRVRAIRPDATIIDRCNLTILLEPGYEEMAEFLAFHRIQVVASMPCYQPKNVNLQRGEGVFDASIEALKRLNALGYGTRSELALNLVYNPIGAVLPPDQGELEKDYKTALRAEFGIEFNSLFTITNMPIARFLAQLRREGQNEMYRQLLVDNFNPASIDGLMCRDTISVDWEGRVFDCDFNQMLGMPLGGGQNRLLWELDPEVLEREPIATGDHCFGCTAGAGSSCGGALD
jgi:radical SAM/Cys-rich protein|tara:strand:+ start:3422 stop:4399 length:978 start_codon:yes stop_codon:yes gene_type:complete